MKRRAFTLIELLVAISIIALLIAILMPALQSARGAARNLQCLSKQRQLGVVYQMHLSDQDDHLVAPSAGGSRWSAYLMDRYTDAILKPESDGALTDSLLVCSEDPQPFGSSLSYLQYASYKIERGGSYALNFDAHASGPSGGYIAMGRHRPSSAGYDADVDEDWWSERFGVIVAPTDHVLLWDTNGPRTDEVTPAYRFERTDHLDPLSLPDPDRHQGGVGNLLFMDGHAQSVKATRQAIDARWITWDHSQP